MFKTSRTHDYKCFFYNLEKYIILCNIVHWNSKRKSSLNIMQAVLRCSAIHNTLSNITKDCIYKFVSSLMNFSLKNYM